MFSSFVLYIQLIVLHNDINKKCSHLYNYTCRFSVLPDLLHILSKGVVQ